jgi:hypothetical protein
MPSGGRKVEDPRPIRDKAYMSKSIRKLIVYLSEHGYDRSISSQILTSPTTKDFLSIISFLLTSIDPNFKFLGKFEDEIPSVLKLISYPTTVGRSALTAIGNPTSWPQLLAALSWLTDLLKVRLLHRHRGGLAPQCAMRAPWVTVSPCVALCVGTTCLARCGFAISLSPAMRLRPSRGYAWPCVAPCCGPAPLL